MKNNIKFLDVFIGNQCNLTCFQCDTRSDIIRTKKTDPDLETIKQGILLAQKHYKIEYYSTLGGEPLLYLDRVEEVIKFIRETDPTAKIVIPTNGTLLGKKFKEVARLIRTYKVSLFICNHYAGFEDKTMSDKLRETSKEFISYMNMSKFDNYTFLSNLLDFENTRNDAQLQGFLDLRKDSMKDNVAENDDVYTDGEVYIWARDQSFFQSHYYFNEQHKPKPFASGDPLASYVNGCCSMMCSFLYDKKIYKCAALGTLKQFLKHHKATDDPDWQKYLNYKFLDLENCTTADTTYFSDTKYSAVDTCDMCPSQAETFIKTYDKVIPIVQSK